VHQGCAGDWHTRRHVRRVDPPRTLEIRSYISGPDRGPHTFEMTAGYRRRKPPGGSRPAALKAQVQSGIAVYKATPTLRDINTNSLIGTALVGVAARCYAWRDPISKRATDSWHAQHREGDADPDAGSLRF